MATLVSGINVANGTVITPAILNAAPTLTPGTVAPTDLTTGGPSWDSSGNQTIGGSLNLGSGGRVNGGSPTGILSVPTGVVMPFAYSFTQSGAPAGWLICDGSFYSTTTYANLYALIQTLYGSGSGTFAVPDLRGYFIRGTGTNADGTAAGTFGSKIADAYASHNHTLTDPGHNHTLTDPGHTHTAAQWDGGSCAQGGAAGFNGMVNQSYTTQSGNSKTGITISAATTGITIAASGSTETRPRNIAMLYCIKA
jgi:microcystin-dependent protein